MNAQQSLASRGGIGFIVAAVTKNVVRLVVES